MSKSYFSRGRLPRTALMASLVLMLLLLAGCSAANLQTFVPRTAQRQPTAANTPPASPSNRLLIQGIDGNIYSTAPDGSGRFALTTDASLARSYTQPAWSPDGSQVAWSRLDRTGSALVTSAFDGSRRSEVRVPFLPFYINWSPAGDRLAYLSNWQVADEPSIALRLVEVAENGNTVTTLAAGQPFYFSWAPDGEQVVTHIGNERVERQAIEDEPVSLIISGGDFPTPQWAPDGGRLLYAVADAATQALVVADLAGNPQRELTTFDGRITFLYSPDGRRVAYVPTDGDLQASTLGPLYVVEPETLRTVEVTDRPVLAFFWSPDASKLAYLTLERVRNRIGMRWTVWDGRERTDYAAFLPTRTFLSDYLPFFDQYAQSHRIWAPDSKAFVFSGTLTNGESGVWVQRLGAGVPPANAGTGVFATWSPE